MLASRDEIEIVQHVSQRTAAFLLSISPRMMRMAQYRAIGRGQDGSYDVRDLIEFACNRAVRAARRERIPLPPLSAEELAMLEEATAP